MESKFSITVNLTESQIKEAIAAYLSENGYSASPHRVLITRTVGDRPSDCDSYSASAAGCVATNRTNP